MTNNTIGIQMNSGPTEQTVKEITAAILDILVTNNDQKTKRTALKVLGAATKSDGRATLSNAHIQGPL